MNLLEDLKFFSFTRIYTIHKILVLIKNHLNYYNNNIFECLRSISLEEESLSLEEENIIKDIKNLFRLKKEQNFTAIKDIRNLFRQEIETKAIKHRIPRDIKNLFEHKKKEEHYYIKITYVINRKKRY